MLSVNNTFRGVKYPVVDEEAVRKAAEERMKRYLGRRDPVAAWTFDAIQDGSFADGSGNGFSAAVEDGVGVADGVRGHAARFDGKGYLRVEEPAVFNAPERHGLAMDQAAYGIRPAWSCRQAIRRNRDAAGDHAAGGVYRLRGQRR